MSRVDDIVVGAGVNGLVAATRLAMGGRRVLVVERNEHPGGRSAGREFHPGFRSPGLLSDTSAFRAVVERELDLGRFGVARRRDAPGCVTLGSGGSVHDPASVDNRWHAWVDAVAPVVESFFDDDPIELLHPERAPLSELLQRGYELRRLGRRTMMQLLRVPPMSLADWLRESFDDESTMAALAVPALMGTWLAPRSPGSAFNLLLDRAAAAAPVRGGTPALVGGLVEAARAASVEIRYGAAVRRLLVDDGRIAGVELEDGTALPAGRVAVTNGPRVAMLDWLPPGLLPWTQRRRYEAFRCRGTTAQLLLALDGVPEPLDGVEFAQTATCLDDLERAFDPIKYRAFASRPVLWLHHASLDARGLAPADGAVLSVWIQYAPYELDGGWTDDARARLMDAAMAVLEETVPGLPSRVVGARLLDPTDLERDYGLSGGQVHHGEHALDQWLVRPEPDAARYASPLPGLWFAGGGSHPGGALTGAPGRHAARAMLAD